MTVTLTDPIGSYTYEVIDPADVPADLRWETPRRHQGQHVERSYATSRPAAANDLGDPWMRIVDHSVRPPETTYYRRIR